MQTKNNDFELQRKELVESLKKDGVIKSKDIEKAFLKVKRECFLPKNLKPFAYVDEALPIGHEQTISQPTTIAIMLEMLKLRKGLKVLEIGSGSGYVLALLAEIIGDQRKVFGAEVVEELCKICKKNLLESGYSKINVFCGNALKHEWQEKPFDRIIFSCAVIGKIPEEFLLNNLSEGGYCLLPFGTNDYEQELLLLQKKNNELATIEKQCCFLFVPLKK